MNATQRVGLFFLFMSEPPIQAGPLIGGITNDLSRLGQESPRFFFDTPLYIIQVRRQYSHLIPRRLQLFNQIDVPIPYKSCVRIDLQGVVFSTIQSGGDVSCEGRPDGQRGFHFVDINLIAVLTECLVGLLCAGYNGQIATLILAVFNLIDDADAKALWIFGS